MKRKTLLTIGMALGISVLSQAQNKPNVIVILIDDMGWADFSCFGNTNAQTPNIDSMAEQGIRFNHFYVNAPICSPTRVALSTGQYPHRHKITSYLASRALNTSRGMAQWLEPSAPMLAKYLNAAGYATGHFGKWHMGGQRDVTDAPLPTVYGFDESLVNFEGIGPKLLPTVQYPNPEDVSDTIDEHIWNETQLGGPITYMRRSEITGGFANNAMRFMDEAIADGKPFYVNIWPDDVHTPMYPSIDRWSDDPLERYRAVLEQMDEQFGGVFEKIKSDSELRNNTLIFICSDNGPQKGYGSPGVFKGNKGQLYEGGIRSPLIVWGPGFIHPTMAGIVNDTSVVAAFDILPSVLSIAGIALAEEDSIDGVDMSQTFLGNSLKTRPEPIFFRRPPGIESNAVLGNLPDLAIRFGDYKLLCDYGGVNVQLYNVVYDPSETNDLALVNKALTDSLLNAVLTWNELMPDDASVPDYSHQVDRIDPAKLVFFFPFDDDMSDASGNQVEWVQDAGPAPAFVGGKVGKAVSLNNMRFVTKNDSVFNPYNTHTISAWVKLGMLPSELGNNEVILHQFDDPENNAGRVYIEVLQSGGGLSNVISSFTGGNSGSDHRTTNNASSIKDRWYHVASVWDREGGKKYLYVDGQLVSTVAISSIERCFGQFVFGANKSKAFFTDGEVDELFLIEEALSPKAIQDVCEHGVEQVIATTSEDHLRKPKLEIYPNPNKGTFTVCSSENLQRIHYRVFGLNGVMVKSGFLLSGKNNISLDNVGKGIYFFVAGHAPVLQSVKFMVF